MIFGQVVKRTPRTGPVQEAEPTAELVELVPAIYGAVPDYICDPNRAGSTAFSHRTKEGYILQLWLPSIMHDGPLRTAVIGGASLYDAYAATMGVAKVPDFPMRPCIRSALLVRQQVAGQSLAKSTCDQYWRCFQEYTSGVQAYPRPGEMDRRMQIAPGIFTPSPREEKCIRESFFKIGSLRDAYNYCKCADIFPTWPGAVAHISQAIRANPGKNLYWVIKEHYLASILPIEEEPEDVYITPVVTREYTPYTTPAITTPVVTKPKEIPTPEDADQAAAAAATAAEEERARQKKTQLYVLLGVAGFALLMRFGKVG